MIELTLMENLSPAEMTTGAFLSKNVDSDRQKTGFT